MSAQTQVQVEGIQTMDEAIKIANEIERLEAVVETLKDDLKEFVKRNGPVVTETSVWGFKESVSYSFTPEQLKKVAQTILLEGKNPWMYLSITASNLKKVGWDDSTISKYGSKKISNRFGSRKK